MIKKTFFLAFILSGILASCMKTKGSYEVKTPCVFWAPDVEIIEPNPCDFRPIKHQKLLS